MIKKLSIVGSFLVGIALGIVMLSQGPAWARAEGTWWYNTLILDSSQTMSIAGTETHTGTETHSGTATFSGTMSPTGNTAQGSVGSVVLAGTGTAVTTNKVIGLFITPSVDIPPIGQATTIPVNGSYERIVSTGLTLNLLAALPTIATSYNTTSGVAVADGAWLTIVSTAGQNITFNSNAAVAGTLLKLGAATRVVTQHKSLTLQFDQAQGLWYERSYNSNAN